MGLKYGCLFDIKTDQQGSTVNHVYLCTSYFQISDYRIQICRIFLQDKAQSMEIQTKNDPVPSWKILFYQYLRGAFVRKFSLGLFWHASCLKKVIAIVSG